MILDYLKPDTWLSQLRHPIYNFTDDIEEGFNKPVEFFKKMDGLVPKLQEDMIKNQEKIVSIEQQRDTGHSYCERPIELPLADKYGMTKQVVEEKRDDFQDILYGLSTTEQFHILCMKVPAGRYITREIIQDTKKVVQTLLNELEITWRCIDEGVTWLEEEYDELCKIQSMHEYLESCVNLGFFLSQCTQLVYAYYKYITEPETLHIREGPVQVGITAKEAGQIILYHVDRIRA